MARILTGIQSTGTPHLGNILGAIIPAIELSSDPKNQSLFFIADLHSFTTIKDKELLRKNTYSTAACWLAFGFDTDKNIFYRQSDVIRVCELTWYLSCFTPYPMLANSHSFKDKSDKLSEVNTGLFTYPVLMAADILLYDANIVPVGKDQKQHLEITRDIASSFNHKFPNSLIVPQVKIDKKVMAIPGTDGQKMSKSYKNFIDIFLPEKKLKKQIMSIITDSISVDDPKNPDNCTVFKLYEIIADKSDVLELEKKYRNGGYGYGHAKKELFEVILEKYKSQRELYNHYINNQSLIEQKLIKGAEKANEIAITVIDRVRKNIGY